MSSGAYGGLIATILDEIGERSLHWLSTQTDVPPDEPERLALARAYSAGFLDAVLATEFDAAQPREEGETDSEADERHARAARRRVRKLLRLLDEIEEA